MKKLFTSVCCIVLAVFMIIPAFAAPTTQDIVDAALLIIRSNEGEFDDVNANDNGALSIGFLQWHADRALNLLRDIIKKNDANALKILGKTLYNEIKNTSTSWATRILTESEAKLVSALLATEESKEVQTALANSNVTSYVTHGINLGITSPSALVYFADIENQCGGGGSARIAKAAKTLAGSKSITLEYLHKAALADAAGGRHPARRNKVYNYALLLGWETDQTGEKYEIWKTTAALNVRSGPGTTYEQVTSYANGTYVAVYEKTLVGSTTWGRTPAGWISMAYCTYVTNPFDHISANTRDITFDAAGGVLSAEPKGELTVNVVNGYRATNYLAVYTSSDRATSGTNKYGAELTVDSTGKVTCEAVTGVGNLTIPQGGIVVSAHGTAVTKLQKLAKTGNYIHFDIESMTVSVYETENEYLAAHKSVRFNEPYGKLPTPAAPADGLVFTGWFVNGNIPVTSKTVVLEQHSSTLVAAWKGEEHKIVFDLAGGYFETGSSVSRTVNGVNVARGDGDLIVYDGTNGKTASGTNKWGVDIAVPADGVVTADPVLNTCNLTIPKGGFVLSGHNASCNWIMNNISKGCYVKFDKATMTLTVWSSKSDYIGPEKIFTSGLPVGDLPTPKKDGDTFVGWVDQNGKTVTKNTVITATSDITLKAKWEGDTVPGDVDGNGKVNLRDMYHLSSILKGRNDYSGLQPDVDGNGKINLRDIYTLKNIMLGRN